MKNLVAMIISLLLCFSLCTTTAFAVETDNTSAVQEVEINIASAVHLWPHLKENGYLYVDENGLLAVDSNNEWTTLSEFSEFLSIIEACNQAILDGILIANPDTIELSTVYELDEQLVPYAIENGTANLQHEGAKESDDEIMPQNAAHGCSVQALNLLNMCENNYQTLVDYYWDMVDLQIYNPQLDPWLSTAGFWVGKVAEGGAWDYKTVNGFAPWYTEFCCYFNSNFQHVTSEYIGNFNYGYTGSFLFSLNVLHFGSSAVSGFDPADEDDWPAIDAGYYAKQ